jgi:hypothetical protein
MPGNHEDDFLLDRLRRLSSSEEWYRLSLLTREELLVL